MTNPDNKPLIKVGIIGATGYAGAELTRLIAHHPMAEIAALGSKSFKDMPLSDVYPSYLSFIDVPCVDNAEVIDKSDVVFACLPHGLSQQTAQECVAKNKIFIDLGADFRLKSEKEYEEWYGGGFLDANLHETAVYGLPELFRESISDARLIANPGCYPTSAALGLYPALKRGLCETDGIIVDSKSGVTGAGREPSMVNTFCEVNEGFAPYKVAAHRHTPEIEQSLSAAAGKNIKITFVPHLLPVNRGIVSTMYVRLKLGVAESNVREAYEAFYKDEPFVRLLQAGKTANLKNVRGTNVCDISLHMDRRTSTLVVVSCLDNMVKGAAGQAVQNMNIACGIDETSGLKLIPAAF